MYMQEPKHQSPFKVLGRRLKLIRENRRESLAEVSGAVEIDTNELERIEQGEERPSEDILMLLINHFGIQEAEAIQLWESAGYAPSGHDDRQTHFGDQTGKPTVVLLAIDARVLYTDGMTISGNQHGLVMHFSQQAGQERPLPVARVGMSFEQAEAVLGTLQQALLRHKYLPNQRLLPPGDAQ
jgi:transcriptional regulator with XRE-family HTH domain